MKRLREKHPNLSSVEVAELMREKREKEQYESKMKELISRKSHNDPSKQ